MTDKIINDADSRMKKSISVLKEELSKLRTGRAHPSVLSHLKVDYYGNETPLSQVANIAIEDARTLTVTPWEKTMVAVVEKAIMKSDLGLNPNSAGTVIRVPMPPLTEERRRSLVKVVREEAEKARVSVRNVRRDANQDIKDLTKAKEISEDEQRRSEERVQKVTDSNIKLIEQISQSKESDLMKV